MRLVVNTWQRVRVRRTTLHDIRYSNEMAGPRQGGSFIYIIYMGFPPVSDASRTLLVIITK